MTTSEWDAARTEPDSDVARHHDIGADLTGRNDLVLGGVCMNVGTVTDDDFVAFVRTHTDSLLRTATLLTRSSGAGEELLQDVYAHLYPQWSKVVRADSELGYVRRALVNRFLSGRRRLRPVESLTDLPEIVLPTDEPARIDDRDQLRRLLDRLPERQRIALILRFFHDLDDSAVAATLDCKVGTARSLISRALATLRQEVADSERQIS